MLVKPVIVLGLGRELLKEGDRHTEIVRMPHEKRRAARTGWWVLPGSPEAEAPGGRCPALKATGGLLNTQPPSPLLHPGLVLRPTGRLPSRLGGVDIFSPCPGPETSAPCALTPSSSPPTQDTADYVKPVTFWVEYSLEDPDHGPVLDDGWPTTLRVSVRPRTQGAQPGRSVPVTPTSSPKPRPRVRRAQKIFPYHTLPSPAQ